MAYGKGVAKNGRVTYLGTFFNDKPDGICTHTDITGVQFQGEYREGKKHGKMTTKYRKNKIFNEIW